MTDLYVIGGQQKCGAHFKDEWNFYQLSLVAEVSFTDGVREICAEYTSPPEARPDKDPSILFKAGTLVDDMLYVCTQTEVMVFQLPDFERIGYTSLPCFNDLHHVRPNSEGNLLVVNTGLDMVHEMTMEGKVLREWDVLGGDPWERFSRTVDYRKVATTKPHRSHPNYVFQTGEDVWVTRFEQRDAICLTREDKRIPIDIERPHDGVVRGDAVYFTTVDGHVVVANTADCCVDRVIDLNRINGGNRALGWCRGLTVIDDAHVIVGFSRLRPSKFRENVRWVQYRFGKRAWAGDLPTRIALYNLNSRELCWEHNLEEHGINAVFSIHPIAEDVVVEPTAAPMVPVHAETEMAMS